MTLLAEASPWAGVPITGHLAMFSPMIALVLTMLAVVACPLMIGRGPRIIATVVALGVAAAFGCTLWVADRVIVGGLSGLSTQAAAGLLVVDNLAVAYQLILLVFLAGVMWLWWMGSAEREQNPVEFFILLLGSALGMILMVSSANLLMIVIAIETASLPSYAIVGFDKRDRKGAEASLKYMIFGAVSAAIMLYGVSILYGLVGDLSLAAVAQYTVDHLVTGENRLLLGVGLAGLLGGIAFKISAVPFHFWCPDAFEGARIEVTTWLSVVSKAAGLILLMRVVMSFCAAVDSPLAMGTLSPIAWTIGIIASVTCTVGNFAAYRQESVKRLLAYSSVAHAGYMMMAAAVFIHPAAAGYESAITPLLVYVLIYMIMNLGAFGVTAMVQWDSGSDRIEAFTNLIRRSPGLAVPMVVCLMSLVGLPPFAGFLGKWWILWALGSMHGVTGMPTSLIALGWVLIIVAATNTLISLYFYMRVVVRMTLREDRREAARVPMGGVVLVNACAIALLALFLFGQPVRNYVDRYSRSLYQASVQTPAAPALAEVPTDGSITR